MFNSVLVEFKAWLFFKSKKIIKFHLNNIPLEKPGKKNKLKAISLENTELSTGNKSALNLLNRINTLSNKLIFN